MNAGSPMRVRPTSSWVAEWMPRSTPPPPKCPNCGEETPRLRGVGDVDLGEREVRNSSVRCLGCGCHIGRFVITFDTIFGLTEDRAVLNGRCRVY